MEYPYFTSASSDEKELPIRISSGMTADSVTMVRRTYAANINTLFFGNHLLPLLSHGSEHSAFTVESIHNFIGDEHQDKAQHGLKKSGGSGTAYIVLLK